MNKKIFMIGVMLMSCSAFGGRMVSVYNMIQNDCRVEIEGGRITAAIDKFREAIKRTNESPMCSMFSIIEAGLIESRAVDSLEYTDWDCLTEKSVKALQDVKDEQLEKVFSTVHKFYESNQGFSVMNAKEFLRRYNWEAENKKLEKKSEELEQEPQEKIGLTTQSEPEGNASTKPQVETSVGKEQATETDKSSETSATQETQKKPEDETSSTKGQTSSGQTKLGKTPEQMPAASVTPDNTDSTKEKQEKSVDEPNLQTSEQKQARKNPEDIPVGQQEAEKSSQTKLLKAKISELRKEVSGGQ